MPKKQQWYGGNNPNSPTYDSNLPIGYFPQLASYYDDDSEDYNLGDDEQIPNEEEIEEDEK